MLKDRAILNKINAAYPESDMSLEEKLYCFYHNLKNIPDCPICSKKLKLIQLNKGFQKYCSRTCMYKDKEHWNNIKNTCVEKYGVDNPGKSKEIKEKIESTNLERYGFKSSFQNRYVQEKFKLNCIEKYGADNPNKLEAVKKKKEETFLRNYGTSTPAENNKIKTKMKDTNLRRYGYLSPLLNEEVKEKTRSTNIERYGVEYHLQNSDQLEKIKEINQKRYGVDFYPQSEEFHSRQEEIQEKVYKTKKKNKSLGKSKEEFELLEILLEKFPDTLHQHRSDVYPFVCDFYIPSEDLYIEYQGNWTHGKEPFDENKEEHLEIIKHWKEKADETNFKNKKKRYFNQAINTWAKRDVQKRSHAKKHGLNWLEFFNRQDFLNWINSLN